MISEKMKAKSMKVEKHVAVSGDNEISDWLHLWIGERNGFRTLMAKKTCYSRQRCLNFIYRARKFLKISVLFSGRKNKIIKYFIKHNLMYLLKYSVMSSKAYLSYLNLKKKKKKTAIESMLIDYNCWVV